MYHPDRHMDEDSKKDADELFRRIQRAHDGLFRCFFCFILFRVSVLSDSHKRAVYDTVGSRGLSVGGWELVPQLFTPNQVRCGVY
jgi:DnaJ family protein C protein 11